MFNLDEYRFTFLALLNLSAAVLVCYHSGLVLYRERYSPVSRSFLVASLALAAWLVGGSFLGACLDESVAFLWAKVQTLGLALIPAAVYHFVALALATQERDRRKLFAVWCFAVFFFILTLTTDYPFRDLYRYAWGFCPRFGWTSVFYMAYFTTIMLVALRQIFMEYRGARRGGLRWFRARGLLLVLLVGYVASIDLLPSYGISVEPIGGVFLFMATAIAVGAFKHYRFLDVTPAFAARTIMDTMSDALLIVDPEGVIRHSNSAAVRIFEMRQDALDGSEANAVLPAAALTDNLDAAFGAGDSATFETTFDCHTRGRRQLSVCASLIRDHAARPVAVIYAAQDVTERKLHSAHLEQIAHHDALTGLPNRLLFGDRLRLAIAQNQRDASHVAVCYLDLDGFKEVNDRFGHEVGDQLLIEVANRLTACVRGTDTVARLGGDEFVILLSGLSDETECRQALDRLLRRVSAPCVLNCGESVTVSASIGVSLFPSDRVDPDTLVRHADHAMYVAKQAGKNRYQLFDHSLEQRIEARLATICRVAKALELDQFCLYYQPKVNCRQSRVVGAEALIRWQHPTLGLLLPAEFIPLIEDEDLALPVGEWVIRKALSQIVAWRREGVELRISINAFARQLLQPDFTHTLASILADYPGAGPDCLQIEIVETAALKDLDGIRHVIEDCRKLGVTFSLDDFGTGYSTLAHLRHLPAEEIKVDQSFVRDMLLRTEDLAIVDAVIGLGRAFGRSVVAEGVETQAHIDRLLTLGCDVMQGYALARPMAAGDFLRWLRDFRLDPVYRLQAGEASEVGLSASTMGGD